MDSQRDKAMGAFGKDFMRAAESAPSPRLANGFAAGGVVRKAEGGGMYLPITRGDKGRFASGGVVKCAAGGVGKVRKGQARQPGRGEPLI